MRYCYVRYLWISSKITDNQKWNRHLKLLCASSLSVFVTINQNSLHPCSQIATLQKILLLPKESVNTLCVRILQWRLKKGQMDLRVRYWDSATNNVTTQYYNSQFLGEAACKDLLEKFKQCMGRIDQDMLLQVSMDGSNVNTSFLSMLSKERREEEFSDLVSIITCGLHTVHNLFKHRIQLNGNWKLLSSVYKTFQESPSRRSDYETLTAAETLTLIMLWKSCGHRWLGNESNAKKARKSGQKL